MSTLQPIFGRVGPAKLRAEGPTPVPSLNLRPMRATSGNQLSALDVSNVYLDNYMNKVLVDVGGLERDLRLLDLRVKNYHHPVRDTWEANILTRLIEVAHAKQTRKLPPGVAMREASTAERDILSRAYHIASKRVTLNTIHKLGLSEAHYEALQRYPEILVARSPNPFQTESAFASWLVEERDAQPQKYVFWAVLFPVCYGRTVEESAALALALY